MDLVSESPSASGPCYSCCSCVCFCRFCCCGVAAAAVLAAAAEEELQQQQHGYRVNVCCSSSRATSNYNKIYTKCLIGPVLVSSHKTVACPDELPEDKSCHTGRLPVAAAVSAAGAAPGTCNSSTGGDWLAVTAAALATAATATAGKGRSLPLKPNERRCQAGPQASLPTLQQAYMHVCI